jgi:hypothetical protein
VTNWGRRRRRRRRVEESHMPSSEDQPARSRLCGAKCRRVQVQAVQALRTDHTDRTVHQILENGDLGSGIGALGPERNQVRKRADLQISNSKSPQLHELNSPPLTPPPNKPNQTQPGKQMISYFLLPIAGVPKKLPQDR